MSWYKFLPQQTILAAGLVFTFSAVGCTEDDPGTTTTATTNGVGTTTTGATTTTGSAGAGTTATTGVATTTGTGSTTTTTGTTATTGVATTTGTGSTGVTTGMTSTTTGEPDGGGASGGTDGGSTSPPAEGSCPGLPAVTDFAAPGPFGTTMEENTGPDGSYILYRPDDASLGMNGLKHPVVVWGNGILTTADQYQQLLGHFASHGFVIIACPSSQPEEPCLNDGMEWLVAQNDAAGPLQGQLDVTKEITMGYSWGGGAGIDTSTRPNVKASISFHGMPPRNNPWGEQHAPVLYFTSQGDTFVSAEQYVLPNYESTQVPAFYTMLMEDVGHLYPIDEGAVSCVASVALGGPCAASIKEQAPAVAWMRHFACDDNSEAVKKYFYGPNAVLCQSPWGDCRTKPSDFWQ